LTYVCGNNINYTGHWCTTASCPR